MPSSATALELIEQVDRLAGSANSPQQLMSDLVDLLHDSLRSYNWVGFYMLDESVQPPVLALGPYNGAPTPHTRIPLDQGICGAAASSGRTIVVDDVNSDPRYLACSTETRSEIVAPIYWNQKVIGELDVDSHSPAAFSSDDRRLVERCAAVVGQYMEEHGR
jgi:L-methionine (R)-S-oxide reductase